jgi:hypothetical protein
MSKDRRSDREEEAEREGRRDQESDPSFHYGPAESLAQKIAVHFGLPGCDSDSY